MPFDLEFKDVNPVNEAFVAKLNILAQSTMTPEARVALVLKKSIYTGQKTYEIATKQKEKKSMIETAIKPFSLLKFERNLIQDSRQIQNQQEKKNEEGGFVKCRMCSDASSCNIL